MDAKKIAFIIAINNEEKYEQCFKYLSFLRIPEGFFVDVVGISDFKNLANAFNLGMHSSDAKYKVYITETTWIYHQNFIEDMISVFDANNSIGILGMSGTISIPIDGICEHSKHKIGKVVSQSSGIIHNYKSLDSYYEEVQSLDGYLMATQYDVQWREGLFSTDDFSAVSQCLEYKRAGYIAVVVQQNMAWVSANLKDNDEINEKDKNVFLDEYSKDVFPLVSILMPTYNRPKYFCMALESALKQSYRNLEIVISDDSDNEETKKLIGKYLDDSRIKYCQNKGFGILENWLWVLENSTGEYFNYLLDDDLFAANKVEEMVQGFRENESVGLVTSYRHVIDEHNNILPDIIGSGKLIQSTNIISGKFLQRKMLMERLNLIGEVTTVLVPSSSKKVFRQLLPLNVPIGDVWIWLELCGNKDVLYMPTPLSYFRHHKEQMQNSMDVILKGALSWIEIEHYYYYNNNVGIELKEYKSILKKIALELGTVITLIEKGKKEIGIELVRKLELMLKILVDEDIISIENQENGMQCVKIKA
jgi:glycosyltransferase involved in cell wall biosynthesis